MIKKSAYSGFTLVEILVTMIIVGILTGIIIIGVATASDKAEATRLVSDLRNLKSAAIVYKASGGEWPSDVSDLKDKIGLKTDHETNPIYSVAFDNTGKFMGFSADLTKTGAGVKSKLEKVASSLNLYSDVLLKSFYEGEAQVIYPVISSASNALFAGDLSSLDQFKKLFGPDWTVVDGKLLSPGSTGERRLAFGDKSWTDYTLSLTGRFVSGYVKNNSGYGVYYRADDVEGQRKPGISGYSFQFDTGYNAFVVRVVTNGEESSAIQRVPFPAGFDINAPHAIEIKVEGSRHVMKVDGQTVMDFSDSTYLSGGAGVRTWYQSVAEFSDINVTQ